MCYLLTVSISDYNSWLNRKPSLREGANRELVIEALQRARSTVEKAAIAEALYKNGSIPVQKMADQLDISKTTLYLYLRYRNVNIGEKIN